MVHITNHADSRRKTRVHIDREGFSHLLDKVLAEGVKHSDVKGKVKKYMDFLFLSHDNKANNIRLYGEFVYILNDETLITVLHLPLEFRNYKKYLKK